MHAHFVLRTIHLIFAPDLNFHPYPNYRAGKVYIPIRD